MKYILEALEISKSYLDGENKLLVLDNLELRVPPSEIIIIKGPSGSGKTTLLNILNTLDKPDFGIIKINEQIIDYNNDKALDKIRLSDIGILYQDSIQGNKGFCYMYSPFSKHTFPLSNLKNLSSLSIKL